MTPSPIGTAAETIGAQAARNGRICAVAGRIQREMRDWCDAYPTLFSAKPFDATLFSTLSVTLAFSGHWMSAAELRTAARMTLWSFGLDWHMDYLASSPGEARETALRCLAVATGAPAEPGDDLTAFLGDIRAELAETPAFPTLEPVWREEFERMLGGMTREWDWRAAETAPGFEEYLANADSVAFSCVFTAFWISTSVPEGMRVAEVREASHAVQRVIRLINDLATYERDVRWGDLNALRLGVGREEVERRVVALTTRARGLLREVRPAHPHLADYMEGQMDFVAGFWQGGDYWGEI
ncbi:terpene synthase family protein [Spongiactinospora sp. TRM90649]|uniref:terpene synthase family protein n=1 Tax=Spongiactinospora sp. TRM90649 TaxID=3031114 RepID=UPI0023F83747|nr:terpene synthase family protein [Spongiactinospora sp. TRM90649]MDF5752028.1 terpene synthase family protein [Spongiactinospora sp. TRM90649]